MTFDVEINIGLDASQAVNQTQAFGGTFTSEMVLVGQQIDRTLGQFSQLSSGISSSFNDAVGSFAGFDQSMKNVESIAVGTNEQFSEMEQLAKDLASQMPTTSTAIADGFFTLASSGLDANEIMSVTPAVMDLAAASATDFDTAAAGVTAALFTYGLELDDTNKITEIFQNTNTQFKTTMPELAESMKSAGSAAAAVGLDFETTAASIGFARNVGLDASSAGTGLRQVLLSLASPTTAAQEVMDNLGFSVQQTEEGNLDLEATMINLRTAVEGIESPLDRAAALETIFSKRGIAVTQALLDNADSLDMVSEALTTQGSVAAAVEIQNAGLENQMLILSGSIEEQQNILGERLAPAALKAEQAKLKLLEATNALPGPLVEVGGGAIFIAAEMGKMLFPIIQAIIQLGILVVGLTGQSTATGVATGATIAHTGATNTYTASQAAANFVLALFPAFLVIAAIIALIAIIVILVKNWDTVTEVMTKLWEFITGAFTAAWEGIVGLFNNVKDAITANIDTFLLIMAVLVPFIGIPLLIINNWQMIVDFLPGIFGEIADAFGDLASVASGWGADLITNFISGMTGKIGDVAGAAGDILGAVGGFLSFDQAANDAMAQQWGQDLGGFMAQGLAQTETTLGAAAETAIGGVAGAPVAAGGPAGGGGFRDLVFGPGSIVVSGSATVEDGRRVAAGIRETLLREQAVSRRVAA